MQFVIYGRLPGLNEYTRANRANKYQGAKMKKQAEYDVIWSIKRDLPMVKVKVPVIVDFRWIEANKRRDLDNIASAKKFIFDGMVKCGLIPDDSWQWVKGFEDHFEIGEPRVVVTLREAE